MSESEEVSSCGDEYGSECESPIKKQPEPEEKEEESSDSELERERAMKRNPAQGEAIQDKVAKSLVKMIMRE